MRPFSTPVRTGTCIRMPQLITKKEGIYVKFEKIKEATGIQETFVLEIKP